MGYFLRISFILVFIFFISGYPFNPADGQAYSPLDEKEFEKGYKKILDLSAENLENKSVRVTAEISGYRGTKEDKEFIDGLIKKVKEYLNSAYNIEFASLSLKYKDIELKEKVQATPSIEFSFILDEHLKFPSKISKEKAIIGEIEKEKTGVEKKRIIAKKTKRTKKKAVREATLSENQIKSQQHNRSGIEYYKTGRYSLAFSEFIEAVIADPMNIQARFNLGVAYQLRERYGEAIIEFQKVLEIEDIPRAHIMLGAVYVMQERFDDALEELKKVVFFEFDSWKVSNEGVRAIRELAKLLDKPGSDNALRLDGHTDSTGPAEYNEMLAKKRAIAVAMELITKNEIEPEAVFISGHGESDPIATNKKKLGRRLNRRVEMIMSRKGVLK